MREASGLRRSSPRDSQVLMVIAADGALQKLPRDKWEGGGVGSRNLCAFIFTPSFFLNHGLATTRKQ